MTATVVEIKNLSKKYKIGRRQSYYSLRDSLVNIFKNPFFKKVNKSEFLALDNVSFQIKKGEILGVIGGNGAGKSTLLKLISQITPPTKGSIMINGRVASLLEVGTGFHPELTGKENIFLNGTILGMNRNEIKKKYKEIVEFSEISNFIDTPVKHYSSGMYMRLAFSIAANLDSEILLVDEVLAVGDAKFQKKCTGKMHDVARSGRTVLFVSHNMSAIQALCTRAILLSKGKLVMSGNTSQVISKYLKTIGDTNKVSLKQRKDRQGNGNIRATEVLFKDKLGKNINFFKSGQDAGIWIQFDLIDKNIREFDFALGIDDFNTQSRIAFISNKTFNNHVKTENKVIKIKLKNLPLTPGKYQFSIIFVSTGGEIIDWVQKAGIFNVEFGDYYGTGQLPPQQDGSLLMKYEIT